MSKNQSSHLSMIRQPELSIITVNYNGIKDTFDLIESIKVHLDIPYEMIVVDNGSAIDESALLQKRYPNITCIRSEKNLGFSGGNNLGIRGAGGKYILLLNNDTFVDDNSIRFLVKRLESDSQIVAVSPKIKFAFPPQNIQFAGYTPLSPITLRNRPVGYGETDRGQYETAGPTPYLHGAALMVKKEIISKIGLMPEIYFLYYEEIDWCAQMTRSNFKLFYEPRCTVFHKESQSTGQVSPLKTYYMTRNRLLYAFRNLNGKSRLLSIAYQIIVVLPKNLLIFLLKVRPDLIKASCSGVFDFIMLKNKHL